MFKEDEDWEHEICTMIDSIIDHPEDMYDLTEELLDFVEKLITTAYKKGKYAEAKKKNN